MPYVDPIRSQEGIAIPLQPAHTAHENTTCPPYLSQTCPQTSQNASGPHNATSPIPRPQCEPPKAHDWLATLRLHTHLPSTAAKGLVPALCSSLGHTGACPRTPRRDLPSLHPGNTPRMSTHPLTSIPSAARAQTQESPPGYPVFMRLSLSPLSAYALSSSKSLAPCARSTLRYDTARRSASDWLTSRSSASGVHATAMMTESP